jgi:hypothetical protein
MIQYMQISGKFICRQQVLLLHTKLMASSDKQKSKSTKLQNTYIADLKEQRYDIRIGKVVWLGRPELRVGPP